MKRNRLNWTWSLLMQKQDRTVTVAHAFETLSLLQHSSFYKFLHSCLLLLVTTWLSSLNYSPSFLNFITGHVPIPIFQQVFELQPSEFERKIRWNPHQGQAHPASVCWWLSGSSFECLYSTFECLYCVETGWWFTNLFDTKIVSLRPCLHGDIA